MKKSYYKIVFAASLLFIVDCYSKWLAASWLLTPFRITDWFSLVYSKNYGVAWSMPVPAQIILPLNLAILAAAAVWLPKAFDLRKKTAFISLSLVFGGALGNIYDRLAFGYVVDFIKIGWWPVFNLADIFIAAGIFIIVVFYGRIKRHN